jgi:hypothetical protein
MNLRIVAAIGRIYTLSFLRRRQSSPNTIKQLTRRPLIILVVDLFAFIICIFFGYIMDEILLIENEELVFLSEMINEMLIFVPAILIALPLAYGILFEFSQAAQTFTTEAVNMLPIRADEYVLGSSLSTIFILSPIISIILGFTSGLVGISRGLYFLWFSMFALSILALSGGAFIVEIIRAITNRVSSAFYSRGGRSTLYVRFVISVIIFLIAMMLFNFNFLFLVLEAYSVEIISVWYVPLLWPSIAILNLIEGNLLLAWIFGTLFLVFCSSCFFASVKLREKYWASQPVSIKISTSIYQPRRGILQRIGFAPVEVALIRKDLRGLVRRKEMIRIVVAPLFAAVVMIITLFVTPQTEEMPIGLFNLLFLMSPILFGWLLGITSFGQEGESIPIIYSLPIKASELTNAKISSSLFIALISLIATLCLIYIILPASSFDFMLFFTFLSVLLTIEATIIGVAVGANYPDFTITPRARFITVLGSMVGMFYLGIGLLIVALPFLVFYTIELEVFNYLVAFGSLILIGLFFCYFTYKIALRNTKKLLERAQVT